MHEARNRLGQIGHGGGFAARIMDRIAQMLNSRLLEWVGIPQLNTPADCFGRRGGAVLAAG
jgi:hypothetical protein